MDGRAYDVRVVRGTRLVLVLAVLVSGCTAAGPARPAPAPQASVALPAASCGSPVLTGPLPEWARGGFSFDGAGVPHVAGRRGDIMAILFGGTLSAPPAPDRNNKILWVSRPEVVLGDPLVIVARRDGAAGEVRREVAGGPGPSTVDLPEPGCWRLTLTWSGHSDTLDLTYVPGGPGASAGPR